MSAPDISEAVVKTYAPEFAAREAAHFRSKAKGARAWLAMIPSREGEAQLLAELAEATDTELAAMLLEIANATVNLRCSKSVKREVHAAALACQGFIRRSLRDQRTGRMNFAREKFYTRPDLVEAAQGAARPVSAAAAYATGDYGDQRAPLEGDFH